MTTGPSERRPPAYRADGWHHGSPGMAPLSNDYLQLLAVLASAAEPRSRTWWHQRTCWSFRTSCFQYPHASPRRE